MRGTAYSHSLNQTRRGEMSKRVRQNALELASLEHPIGDRSATMPIHSVARRQHLLRMGNTSGVSTNRPDNTCSAESCHDQRSSSAARIRHRRGA